MASVLVDRDEAGEVLSPACVADHEKICKFPPKAGYLYKRVGLC